MTKGSIKHVKATRQQNTKANQNIYIYIYIVIEEKEGMSNRRVNSPLIKPHIVLDKE